MKNLFFLFLFATTVSFGQMNVSQYYILDEDDHTEKITKDLPQFTDIIRYASKRITHQSFKGSSDFTTGTNTFLDDKERKVKEAKYTVKDNGTVFEQITYFDEANNPILYYSTMNGKTILGLEMYEYDSDNFRSFTTKYRYGGYVTKEKHPKKYKAGTREAEINETKTIIWQGTDPDW